MRSVSRVYIKKQTRLRVVIETWLVSESDSRELLWLRYEGQFVDPEECPPLEAVPKDW
jgi:hypothetical protein